MTSANIKLQCTHSHTYAHDRNSGLLILLMTKANIYIRSSLWTDLKCEKCTKSSAPMETILTQFSASYFLNKITASFN